MNIVENPTGFIKEPWPTPTPKQGYSWKWLFFAKKNSKSQKTLNKPNQKYKENQSKINNKTNLKKYDYIKKSKTKMTQNT